MPHRKKSTIVAVFETRSRAEQAIADLKSAGFSDKQIGMISRDASGKLVDQNDETLAEEGAVTGAVAGAGAGALVGAGVLAGVIPVVGPVLAVGALGTVLLNAVGGAAIVGIAGALIGWGIPEEDAAYYEQEVVAGRYLVTVEANGKADEARRILHQHGGFDKSTNASTHTAASASRHTSARTGADQVVEVKEEQLHADKRTVEAGEVEVRKEVHTDHKTVTVPVEREEIVVERRPVHRKATAADISTEEIRIPVKEEEVRVSKEAVVKEEVKVGKRKVREDKTISADLKKEEIVVESEGKARVRQTKK